MYNQEFNKGDELVVSPAKNGFVVRPLDYVVNGSDGYGENAMVFSSITELSEFLINHFKLTSEPATNDNGDE